MGVKAASSKTSQSDKLPVGGHSGTGWLPTAKRPRRTGGGERQNSGAVNPFEGKKRGAVNFKLRT